MQSINILKTFLTCSHSNKLKFVKRTYIRRAKTSSNTSNVIVEFQDNTEVYPLIWLRDNCTCSECFHIDSKSRIINWNEFDVNTTPVSTHVDGDKIEIKWNDNHRSIFTEEWLRKRSFDVKNQAKYLEENYRPKRIYWDGADFKNILKTYKYEEVMTKDDVLYYFLKDLAVFGLVMLKDAPTGLLENVTLAKRIAFIRETHYGKEFVVTSKPGTNNVAYLPNFLQLHTDLPYYHYKPGTNFLHCCVQTESKGGQSLLSDSFFVGNKIREENKGHFDLLANVLVNWSDYGTEDGVKFCSLYRSPVISVDSTSEISCVRHSVPQRDSFFSVPLEKVTPWYYALKNFVKKLNTHSAQLKLTPGDILAFDNTRIAHGRLGYEDSDNNHRYLVGLYIDWDEIYSKMRVLKNNL